MAAVPVRWARIVRDLRVNEAFLGQQVSKDLFEAAQGLAFKWPPQAQLRTVRAEPLAESGSVDVFSADDLDAGNNVVSFHGYTLNAGQFTGLLVTRRHGSR